MNDMIVRLTVNGKPITVGVVPDERLLSTLRDRIGLCGTKEGCGIGECGACTVLVDGKAVNSCLVLTGQCDGAEIVTIEGLAAGDRLHPLQQAFIDHGAVQCGFCTPGMILSAKALLDRVPNPTRDDVRTAISGNLCRCTGYEQIIKAVMSVACKEERRDGD